MLSGCRGGAFFHQDWSWCDSSHKDRFIIRWQDVPRNLAPFVAIETLTDVSPTVLTMNRWWLWSDDIQACNVRRPLWWDVTEDSLQVCVFSLLPLLVAHTLCLQEHFPERRVSVYRLKLATDFMRSARYLFGCITQIGLNIFGTPPPPSLH